MGSGGMIVMDGTTCMVDLAKYFLGFTQNESCGKCTFCRIGTLRMKELLTKICDGKGEMEDIDCSGRTDRADQESPVYAVWDRQRPILLRQH